MTCSWLVPAPPSAKKEQTSRSKKHKPALKPTTADSCTRVPHKNLSAQTWRVTESRSQVGGAHGAAKKRANRCGHQRSLALGSFFVAPQPIMQRYQPASCILVTQSCARIMILISCYDCDSLRVVILLRLTPCPSANARRSHRAARGGVGHEARALHRN